MINPNEVTNFNRTPEELEEFLLFCIVVAGKSSQQQSKKLNAFLFETDLLWSPFGKIRLWNEAGELLCRLQQYKIGQYTRIVKAFQSVSCKFRYDSTNIHFHPLKHVTVEELESVKGIGPKTARFFILHSRANARVAVLDTHILKWFRGNFINAPLKTPQGEQYKVLESLFLTYADNHNISPAELDLQIWKEKGLTKPNN